ncbi:MAG TPA: protein kinase [Candidatus Udaeobacter sp.]|nr:protein kinase [Candidatus Udaeobacter sp.]
MATSPASATTVCWTCGAPLDAKGDCVACFLRTALDKSVVETKQLPSLVFGDFEVEQRPDGFYWELGRGGMGVTYLARDKVLRRRVALKVIDTPTIWTHRDSQNARERFLREARSAAALRHPNVAAVYQFGASSDGSRCFYAMELVEGETLETRVRRHGPLNPKLVVEIATQIAQALIAAAAQGLIHRDLKPGNIMLKNPEEGEYAGTPRGDVRNAQRAAPTVKIIDFGLAKAVADAGAEMDITHGEFVGTPNFASPEQFESGPVDVRSDIYSLGATLWFALTGKTPFAGRNIEEIRRAQKLAALPTEQLKAAHVPPPLRSLLKSMLALEPAGRPGVHDLATRLRGCSGQAGNMRRIRFAIASTVILILGASASFIFHSMRTHPAAVESVSNPAVLEKSVAVLPFDNQNRDPDIDYLSDGITESIIHSLSQLSQLKVMARSTVFQYKGKEVDPRKVGHDLGVGAVVLGRLLQQGDNLTIRTELVNVSDGTEVWGQQYNRKVADVFAVQEEIAKQISEKLRLKLSGAERQQLAKRPTENLKAFQYYMQGLSSAQRRTREDLLAAISYYDRAIEEDRNYALAYAGFADAYANLGAYGYIAPIDGTRKTEKAAREAVALDENLAEAHAALALANIAFAPSNFQLGDRELRRAIELSPSLALAHSYLGFSLVRQGRLDESLEEMLKARELDPLSPIIARQAAMPYHLKRDYPRALELLRQANELGPSFTTTWEIGVYIQNKLFNETLAELEKAKRERKSDPILIYDTGMIYAAQGKRAEALQIIKDLEGISGAGLSEAHLIAKIYATLHEKEMALSWLERGLATGAIGVFYKDDPVWDTIRSDPRFTDLVRRTGIPL